MTDKIVMKVFTKLSGTGYLTEDKNGQVRYEEEVKTYDIESRDNEFLIYELFRKGREKELRGQVSKKDYPSEEAVISGVQEERIFIKSIMQDTFKTVSGSVWGTTQSNHILNQKEDLPQLMAVVRVSDMRRHLIGNYLGISRKIGSFNPPEDFIEDARQECIAMSEAKFYSDNGAPKSSGDIYSTIVTERYLYIGKAR
jgi:hypothetical protein